MSRVIATAAAIGLLLAAPRAGAEIKVYKHDQFSPDLTVAAAQVSAAPLATQPGFVKNEGFGQLYHPAPGDYPIKIQGLDLLLAAPPNAPSLTTNAVIEIWLDEADGATPGTAAPAFSVSTADLFNPSSGQAGMPLVGNAALQINFDWDDPEGHPPVVLSGNIRAVVRYTESAADLQSEWNTLQCMQFAELGVCGCQKVGIILDQTTTKKANLMSILSPVGTCSGSNTSWVFAEDVGVTGDILMRLRVDAAGGGCTPSCGGKQCGDDGCGGSCGVCGGGKTCDAGQCISTCTPACGGVECGDDGCGGVCGLCGGGKVCEAGQCITPCTPACGGIVCGDDGCGGSCGSCGAGEACEAGECVTQCVPYCDGKVCGADGCGGSCGPCGPDQWCDMGECIGVCTPDCAGKECGDDGCGGVCGQCDEGTSCSDSLCVCVPACGGSECGDDGCGGACGQCGAGLVCEDGACICVPDCAGKECGDDGCGDVCGTCDEGMGCGEGTCVSDCAPDCGGKECGDDGCGEPCGQCGAGMSCSDGVCVCAPDCTGKACGDDGCGGSCGTCDAGLTCNGGTCEKDCVADCAGKDCGDDGCGGSCGTCDAGATCEGGTCTPSGCTADCAGKECGDDGCGGSCGACGAGEVCGGGMCQVDPTGTGLAIEAISPSSGYTDEETDVTVTGTGFASGLSLKLGGTSLSSIRFVNETLVEATVPKDMEPGSYLLSAINPDGSSATKIDAFEVKVRAEGCGDGTCSASESCSSCPGDCGDCTTALGPAADSGCEQATGGTALAGLALLVALLGLAALRRRVTS